MSKLKHYPINLTRKELLRLAKHTTESQHVTVHRISAREYDVHVEYHNTNFSCRSCGWLPLMIIRDSHWIDLAPLSDYPEMVKEGDWSGIRDSSNGKIWMMLDVVLGREPLEARA